MESESLPSVQNVGEKSESLTCVQNVGEKSAFLVFKMLMFYWLKLKLCTYFFDMFDCDEKKN